MCIACPRSGKERKRETADKNQANLERVRILILTKHKKLVDRWLESARIIKARSARRLFSFDYRYRLEKVTKKLVTRCRGVKRALLLKALRSLI